MATAKHFAAYSVEDGVSQGQPYNRHSFNAIVSDQDLQETYLPALYGANPPHATLHAGALTRNRRRGGRRRLPGPPWSGRCSEASVREAKVRSLMCSYNRVNGSVLRLLARRMSSPGRRRTC